MSRSEEKGGDAWGDAWGEEKGAAGDGGIPPPYAIRSPYSIRSPSLTGESW